MEIDYLINKQQREKNVFCRKENGKRQDIKIQHNRHNLNRIHCIVSFIQCLFQFCYRKFFYA